MNSSSSLRVACLQMTTGNDLPANCAQALALMEHACAQSAEFLALPENAFMMRATDRDLAELYFHEEHPGVMLCREMAAKRGVWVLIGSVFAKCRATDSNERWYNRSLLIDASGNIVTYYDKIHLFDANITPEKPYRESARVMPGNQIRAPSTPWGVLGMTICYDVRFPHLFRDLAKNGAVMMAVPAAFAEHTGKAHWHVLLRARAIETGCFVIAPAQCGEHPGGKRTYGHSLIIGPWGEILAEGSADEPGVILADLDLAQVDKVRSVLPCLMHDRTYAGPDFEI